MQFAFCKNKKILPQRAEIDGDIILSDFNWDAFGSEFDWNKLLADISMWMGIVGFFITCFTYKATRDIKKKLFKKNMLKDTLPKLKSSINDLEGMIKYLGKQKCFKKIEVLKTIEVIQSDLKQINSYFSFEHKIEFKILCHKIQSFIKSENNNEKIQLSLFADLKSFLSKIVIYFEGE